MQPVVMPETFDSSAEEHGIRHSDVDFASRRAEEAVNRRYEATEWLRKMVGVVASKDLPNQPTEEEFCLGLRNGLVLCNVMNKVSAGSIPKVVESSEAPLPPDGAPLSAYQYFENLRNFLVAAHELGLPSFEACDLEKGGSTTKVVDCVLALKAYHDWKQAGGKGSCKYGGNTSKSPQSILRPSVKSARASDSFTSSVAKSIQQSSDSDNSFNQMNVKPPQGFLDPSSQLLSTILLALLSDNKSEEGSTLVQSMLEKIAEEVRHKLATQGTQLKKISKDNFGNKNKGFFPKPKDSPSPITVPSDPKRDENNDIQKEEILNITKRTLQVISGKGGQENSSHNLYKLFDDQRREIQKLKCLVRDTKQGLLLMQMEWSDSLYKLGRRMCGFAKAADNYHKVLEENRQLYNQVQDLKGSIRVYCRVRPFLPGQSSIQSTVDFIGEDGSIVIINHAKKGKDGRRTFTFNKVFAQSASQEAVFLDTQPLIRSVLDGYNVCIFAYGQTGSGKTYTMSGPKVITKENWGVNYRALNDLFQITKQRRDTCVYEVAVQMIEIYNEQVRDLLVPDGSNKRLEIHNNSLQNGLNVPNANLVPVTSTSDVIELMKLGQKNRAVGATALNDWSSRSHSVLTVHVQGRELTSGTILRGCLHLVDLAGSERVDKSEAKGERLKEAQHINKSLSALGDVIAALAQKSSHVPYRNSKLTQVLQDSLGGQAKTLMFIHISPEPDALGETISTLKFAERVATVELGAARSNKESGEVRELKEQIAQLKTALARKELDTRVGKSQTKISPEIQKGRALSPMHLQDNVGNGAAHASQRQIFDSAVDIENHETRRKSRPSYDSGCISESLTSTSSPMFFHGLDPIQNEFLQASSDISLTTFDQVGHFQNRSMHESLEEQEVTKWQENFLIMQQAAMQDGMRSWETNSLGKIVDPSTIYCENYHVNPDYEEERFSVEQLENLQKLILSKKQDAKRINVSSFQKNPYEAATTDDSEVEMDTRSKEEYLTSDSSEVDLLWQHQASNAPFAKPLEHVPMIKKAQQMEKKKAKASGQREHSSAQSVSEKGKYRLPNGNNQMHFQEGRQLASGALELKKTGTGSKSRHDARAGRK